MTDNNILIEQLTEFIKGLSTKPSYKELTNALKKIYKNKSKRNPTEYNIFFKTQSALMKEKGDTMNTKERMAHIAKLWKEKNNLGVIDKINEETVEEIEKMEPKEVKEIKEVKEKSIKKKK